MGEAREGSGAAKVAAATRPDVVLLHLRGPDADSLAALRDVLGSTPATRVLVVVDGADAHTLLPALRAGTTSYVHNRIDPLTIAAAIRGVHSGQTVVVADVDG
ncbi:hypothetical protein Val02_19470 [Virgisporangium aliadipatigenens]|uniref:Response regulatory domain-containing protein n=1 Tax=Virgisporangium aliadipatigenens TaxID=741659 RepID=A0A8J3YH92_9ACTN|nr:hypothetical protein Val02_19470 [Virgisporangium aliadipatigenens]